ncbi:hypothetical protein R1sor_007277 [Riccia sorocarpa]|uniref:Uncharacterized protein n=1 Tax=Riccia sorocarpa TaxID=122646 RepID=A0ABD3HU54_9MARC
MRSIADSPAMRHVENAYHEMADNPRAKPSNFDVYMGPVVDELKLLWNGSLLIQNLGDPMHEKGNITKNLLRHMFGHVDELHHRRACEEFNVHQETWPYRRSDGTEGKRQAPWVFSKQERDLFRQRISEIRTPTGYSLYIGGGFQHVDDKIWGKGMKTHDYHKLIHDILPLVIHELGSEELREAIYALSRLFR